MNYSIDSTAPSSPWSDFDIVGYLNAHNVGIFVATSAGNARAGDETMGSPVGAGDYILANMVIPLLQTLMLCLLKPVLSLVEVMATAFLKMSLS